MVTSSLSPENQAIYDAMIKRQGVFGEEADALAGGGWQDAYQQQFDMMRGMYAPSDASFWTWILLHYSINSHLLLHSRITLTTHHACQTH